MTRLNKDSPMASLMEQFPTSGEVVWIGVRPGREVAVREVDQVEAVPGEGLTGDRFRGNVDSPRQVTLIQAEHLQVVAALLGKDAIAPGLLRRNIVVRGLNLLALKDKRFSIGSAVLEMTGHCHPCSKMEQALGTGGYNAMRGHGGMTAKVIRGGSIRKGDAVTYSAGPSEG